MWVGSDAAPARVLTHSTHPGGPGLRPAANKSRLPGARLTDGRQGSLANEKRGPGRKEDAVMARREAPVLSRGSAATKNNGCATWRAIPLAFGEG